MNVIYGGIKELNARPGVVVIFDVVHDQNAVKEATKLGVPIIGVCDTNANPTGITHPIPCNDDAIKTVQLLADYMKAAVLAGKAKSKTPEKAADKDEK
jgi:small subunit ribosomal protein S2